MIATTKPACKQRYHPKRAQASRKDTKVIPFQKPTAKPLWERSESYRFGHHVGMYLRLESDSSFNFQLRQQVLAHCNEAEFAAGFFEGLFSK